MSNDLRTRNAEKILAEEYLVARSKILEIAATLDRLAIAPGDVTGAPLKELLDRGIAILGDSEGEKAKRLQLLMSRQYDPDWRKNLNVG